MIKETFKQAVQNVLSNKVRTFLTMLGIIIGVMAVIVIVGLGNGMTHMMQDFYSDMGSDILAVNVMTASTRTVEVSDVYNIINQKPEYYKGLSPIASAGGDTLRVAGEKYRRTGISGVNEDYMTINNYKVAKGRGIQYTDLIDNKNICVIGDYVDRRIFGGNGLGSTLKVGASEYRIVGVLEGRSKPASQYEGGNDDIVLVPYTTLMSVNNTSSVSEYYVVLQDADHSDEAQEFLQSRLKKLVSKDDYVYVMSLSAAMKQMSSMINVMVGVLTAIAGISLLVGGIGIMNIMLVSVTERTREIGIRKAIGAERKSIITQFLIEAAVICSIGGLIGIGIGCVGTLVAGKLLLNEDFPGWLYEVRCGATTMWERWDSVRPDGSFDESGMNSFNHYAFGAVGDWLLEQLVGIRPAEPGYRAITLQPQLIQGITQACALRTTPYGRVRLAWQCLNHLITVEVEIPANTTAQLFLPEQEGSITLGSGSYQYSYATETDLTPQRFTMDTPLRTMLADADAKAVLSAALPGMLDGPAAAFLAGKSFNDLKGMMPGGEALFAQLLTKLNQLC